MVAVIVPDVVRVIEDMVTVPSAEEEQDEVEDTALRRSLDPSDVPVKVTVLAVLSGIACGENEATPATIKMTVGWYVDAPCGS